MADIKVQRFYGYLDLQKYLNDVRRSYEKKGVHLYLKNVIVTHAITEHDNEGVYTVIVYP